MEASDPKEKTKIMPIYHYTLTILTKTNGRLRNGALKSPSNTRINTLLLSPRRAANSPELLVLVAFKRLGTLLDNLCLVQRRHLCHLTELMSKIRSKMYL